MIKAQHQFFLYHFFKFYGLWKIRRHFDHVEINGDYIEKDLPLVIIANHISWWDGFWVVYFRQKIVRKKFYFMMLEEELKKNIFLKYAGGYSINKKSRTIVESLNYTQEILQNSDSMVLLFPQGRIESLYKETFEFEKGISTILKKSPPCRIMMIANFVDYFSNVKPTLFMYYKELVLLNLDSNQLEVAYNQFYQEKLFIQKQKFQ
ncbi:MAG TPA: lysophospholipid acyltransferase family protein [Bacteroidales bacterium]|nr:lysophospholipid acyltransferase family protein [Bacteroidales bacterium]